MKIYAIGLGLMLSLGLAATGSDRLPGSTGATLGDRAAGMTDHKEQGLKSGTGEVLQPAILSGAGVNKLEWLDDWRSLPAEEAYLLFKSSDRHLPEELALQFNQSLTVLPHDPADRTAGGSPGTALPILESDPGSSYTDQGDTAVLSNYLFDVPVRFGSSCPVSASFAANDAWYSFSLEQATQVTVSTCAEDYYYDTRIGIFDEDLDLVSGNDDDYPFGASILQSALS